MSEEMNNAPEPSADTQNAPAAPDNSGQPAPAAPAAPETGKEEFRIGNQPNQEAQSWIKEDGTISVDNAPEDIKKLVESKGYKSVDDIVKSYKELERMKGNSLQIPEEGDTEGWDKIYQKLGRPETPDGYELPENIDATFGDWLKDTAFKRGLSNEAVNELVSGYSETASKALEAQEAEAYETLRSQWGSDYDKNMKKVSDFADKFGLTDALSKYGANSSPEIAMALKSIADGMSEDGVLPSTSSAEPSFDEKIETLRNNPAFLDNNHPEHKKVLAEFHSLMGIN